MKAIGVIKRKASLLMVDSPYSQNAKFRNMFRLPETEQLKYELPAEVTFFFGLTEKKYQGSVYISTSCLCFMSNTKKACSFALPFSTIRKVERVKTKGYLFVFSIFTWHMMKFVLSLEGPYHNCEC
ncbi:unnamed protein product [Pneumocystis jirovecii]|uniref:GRAM domain-containing protein n=1 Tax=Pneumocystis jirovecii TaxID=42068 RepID=L0PHK7_PNEJI|nr:unnamed protein product [Pneumocystis jirovecii]